MMRRSVLFALPALALAVILLLPDTSFAQRWGRARYGGGYYGNYGNYGGDGYGSGYYGSGYGGYGYGYGARGGLIGRRYGGGYYGGGYGIGYGDGFYGKAEYSQAKGQHWRVTITAIGIAGASDDFLGQYSRNSHVKAALRYSF